MTAALRMQLAEEAHNALAERFEQTDDAETRLRYQMVLWATEGYTVSQIAPLARRALEGCPIGGGRVGRRRCRSPGRPSWIG